VSRLACAKWILLGIAVAAAIIGLLVLRRPGGSPPTAAPVAERAAVERSDPLAVSSAVAVALYRSTGPGRVSSLLSAHGAAVVAGMAATSGHRRSTAEVASAGLVEPRAAPVVVQVDVVRWWLDGRAVTVDPVHHRVLLTLLPEAGGWVVDDLAVVS